MPKAGDFMRCTLLILLILGFAPLVHAKRIQVSDQTAEISAPKTAETGNALRKKRRVGVGAQGAGALGLGGVFLELNITERDGFVAGFGGGGPAFQAWTIQYKKVLAGEWLLPYMAGGLARWNNFKAEPGITESTPGILTERFMSQSDRERGVINEWILYPAIGLQYVQLEGEWAGFSVFLELDMLIDVQDFVAGPTGALGMSYYF
jgi:hypothetical protein